MITLYRPANYNNPRASEYTGRSIDTKPNHVENGAIYKEMDTGRVYRYDKENNRWIEVKGCNSEAPDINDSGLMRVNIYNPWAMPVGQAVTARIL